jgi:predicted nucleotide-binding protein (sugar kinase/HSP70/actin superfamily)
MTANELAEILRENPSFIILLQNKCEMQEKEIAQLKDELGIKYASIALQLKANNKIKEQAQEITHLKKIVEDAIKQAFYEDDYHKATVKNELLKAELRNVAEQLRIGISKVHQKTLARAIEENLKKASEK